MNSNSNNGPRKKRRWLPYVGVVLLLAGITLGLWPKPLPVETAVVSIGPLRSTVDEEGKTRIKDRFVVSAPVTGQLRRIPFKPGADIKANKTVVAMIDPLVPSLLDPRSRAFAEARRETAKANLEKARVARDFASSELKRFEKLAAANTLSPQELESAKTREAASIKDFVAAESVVREVDAELAQFVDEGSNRKSPPVEVRAPASGKVLRLFEESSRAVNVGTPLVEIGDPANLEVVIEALSRDGAAVPPGTRIELEQWGGGRTLEAKLRLVEPAAFTKVSALGVEEQRVNVVADFVSPPELWQSLGDNFRVEARIIIWEEAKALKVPSGALLRQGQSWMAFVVQGDKAQLRSVKVGRSGGSEVQILDGLKEGEELILYPGDRIKDGQAVKRIKI